MHIMSRTRAAVGVALAIMAAGGLRAQSSVYVVTITDILKNNSYEVMDRDGVKAIKDRIKDETRVFPAAVAAAMKEWEANDLTKNTPFPTAGFSPRKVREEGPFNNEMAQKKVEKKSENNMERAFKKASDGKGSSKNKPSDKELEKLARKDAKDAQKAAAAELIQKQIDKLLKDAQ